MVTDPSLKILVFTILAVLISELAATVMAITGLVWYIRSRIAAVARKEGCGDE